MKEQTLAEIKANLSKFYKVVERIANYWGNAHYLTLSVLLQNAAFSAVGCQGYSHEEAVTKLREIHAIITDISKYCNSHFERWIAEEVDSIIVFAEMANAYDDDIPNTNYGIDGM